jgi:hypothetical protein
MVEYSDCCLRQEHPEQNRMSQEDGTIPRWGIQPERGNFGMSGWLIREKTLENLSF